MRTADGMATLYTETQRMELRSHVNLAGEVSPGSGRCRQSLFETLCRGWST